jgi:hypothetical protein
MTLLPSFCSVNDCCECHTPLRLFAFRKERRPVTPKVAGSSPVAPASKQAVISEADGVAMQKGEAVVGGSFA